LLGHLDGETSSREELLPKHLSEREYEVLRLLVQGKTNPEIAQQLTISVGTVKIHVEHILAKLRVSDRTQAAVRAIELGLLRTTA
jgi:DNA-binding NarL/FixJ family response regulator